MVSEYFVFQSAEGLAAGVFLVLFAAAYSVLIKFMKSKMPVFMISLIIAGIAAWQLYKERYYGWESLLAFLMIVFAIIIFVKIILSFFRGAKTIFGG